MTNKLDFWQEFQLIPFNIKRYQKSDISVYHTDLQRTAVVICPLTKHLLIKHLGSVQEQLDKV